MHLCCFVNLHFAPFIIVLSTMHWWAYLDYHQVGGLFLNLVLDCHLVLNNNILRTMIHTKPVVICKHLFTQVVSYRQNTVSKHDKNKQINTITMKGKNHTIKIKTIILKMLNSQKNHSVKLNIQNRKQLFRIYCTSS